MPNAEVTRAFQGKSALDCFEAALRAGPRAGYKLLKKRDIGYLAILTRTMDGRQTTLNIAARFGSPCPVTVTLMNEVTPEDVLKAEAEKVLDLIKAEL